MLIALERRVAGFKGGRPKRTQESGPATKQVRLNDDLAEMIAWICRINDVSSAQLVDPMLRPQITARYAALKHHVEAIKDAEEKARQAELAAKEAADGRKGKGKKGE